MTVRQSRPNASPQPVIDALDIPAAAPRKSSQYARISAGVDYLLRRFSVPLLRIALAIVFIWFGALKVFGVSPVADLVAGTVPFLDPNWFVPALGGFEVVLGLVLLTGMFVRLTCAALVAHLCGTFLVYVMQPAVAFQGGNPLLMTTEGEFVAKNIVLITAGLAVAAWSATRTGSRHLAGSSATAPGQ